MPHLSRPALDPPSLLSNGYRVSFPGVKRPGRGINHPPLSSAEVKERIELYFGISVDIDRLPVVVEPLAAPVLPRYKFWYLLQSASLP